MRYVDEYRSKELVLKVASKIKALMPKRQVSIMEVCGTHTHNFLRFGLDKLLPASLRLISGPGCPVCVSDQSYIDQAIALSGDEKNLIVSFGDMLGVPGSGSSLEKERAHFGNVRLAYSPIDALKIARLNPDKRVIFLAVGFETTAPTIAASILAARKQKLKNLFFLCALKTMPQALRHLLKDKRLALDGFLCPGHVSAIIGTRPYAFIPKKHGISCCIAGFEPLDIVQGLYLLIRGINRPRPVLENQYSRLVKTNGNPRARKIIYRVFKPAAALWRGLGVIADSGLVIKRSLSDFDAAGLLPSVKTHTAGMPRKCRCGDVLKGLILPKACPLFGKACTPQDPVGPCMVSSEGSCNSYYNYARNSTTGR